MKNLAIIALAALFTISCNKNDDTPNLEPLDLISVSPDGATKALINNICPILGATDPLTNEEIEFIYAAREDEKVVKDVTSKFHDLYPASNPFANISEAEATHAAALETLLTYYEITFPEQGAQGAFVDPKRQARYDQTVALGSTLTGAYRATATLEEENIVAYKKVLPTITNANIKMIIDNILRASSNHLRAYVRQLEVLGERYAPTVLDQASYDAIVSGSFGQGSRHPQHGGQGNTNSGKGGQGHGNKGRVDANGNCTGTPGGGGNGGGNGGGGNGGGGNGGAGKGA